MSKNSNAAHRVLKILDVARRIASGFPNGAQRTTLQAWAEVFSVQTVGTFHDTQRVAEDISLLYAEVREAHLKAKLTTVRPERYEQAFSNIYQAISLANLERPWGTYLNFLTETALNALGFCADLIPDEEEEIIPEEMASIRKTLNSIKQSVEAGQFPDEVKDFILAQVAFVEKAIARYRIQGIKAFTKAAVEAQVFARQDVSTAEEAEKMEPFRQLIELWEKISTVVKHADTAKKIVLWGGGIYEAGGYAIRLLEHIK